MTPTSVAYPDDLSKKVRDTVVCTAGFPYAPAFDLLMARGPRPRAIMWLGTEYLLNTRFRRALPVRFVLQQSGLCLFY